MVGIGDKILPYIFIAHPSSGMLTGPISESINNANIKSCFPPTAGWDHYYTFTNFFCGPNAATPGTTFIPNDHHLPVLSVSTCNTSNGTSLVTGIQIKEACLVNDSNIVCVATNCGINLATATRLMNTSSGSPQDLTPYYQVVVFFKKASAGNLTTIYLNWMYTNN
jgi:hypothetical protein